MHAELLLAARTAHMRRDWRTSYDAFTRAEDESPLGIDDLDALAVAAWQLLMLHGDWSDGLTVAQAACTGLSEPMNAPTLGGAHYLEAEFHRLRREFALAEQAYEHANAFGCQPQQVWPCFALRRAASTSPPRSCGGGSPNRISRSIVPASCAQPPRS